MIPTWLAMRSNEWRMQWTFQRSSSSQMEHSTSIYQVTQSFNWETAQQF